MDSQSENSKLLKNILSSLVVRNLIFKSIKDIHRRQYSKDCDTYSWDSLGCYPVQLIKYNYLERYQQIYSKVKEEQDDNELVKDFLHAFRSSHRAAASRGLVEIIDQCNATEDLNPYFKRDAYVYPLNAGIQNGHINILQYFHQERFASLNLVNRYTMDLCAKHCQLSMVVYLHNNMSDGCTTDAMDSTNSLGIVEFLHNNRSEGCTTKAFDNAIANGNLQIIQFLHENRTEGYTKESFNVAVKNGRLDIVKFLLENRTEEIPVTAISTAITHGQLETLKYLFDKTPLENQVKTIVDNVIFNDDSVQTLQFMIEKSLPFECTLYAMDNAASVGCLEVIKLLVRGTREAMTNAAVNGHLEVLQYIHENRTDSGYSDDILERTAKNRQFETFNYLHDNIPDLKCSIKPMDYFAGYKTTEALEWLNANRTEGCSSEAYANASRAGLVENIKWLQNNMPSIPIPEDLIEKICFHEKLEAIEYLHQSGGVKCKNAKIIATDIGSYPIVEYLHFNSDEGDHEQVIKKAIRCNHDSIIRLLTNDGEIDGGSFIQRLRFIKKHKL
ncbi:hypothetical protein PPL_10519 [Heterostelium album PN500]|uniref:Ankyrin repeat protein n=1 Tax=Heterostelium pallidum (strain ATCC 26659 / Pp 5 / PN500) TaxID=670386 RepID=D3BRB1_HETP5|nr:hypothetical protein PPL_10519 [Heterostelium album PN500]EFA75943.1 hypothetical protein PPL_10519 [Heterostelium album PN500]|eukprot:XP_020428077.1 hypothetical protein PPL_10519 [Heterostelium album PN500]